MSHRQPLLSSCRSGRSVAVLLAACLLVSDCFLAQVAWGQETNELQAALTLQNVLADAIAKAEPSVVAIARVSKKRMRDDLSDPLSTDFIPNEFGSGLILDKEGHILTCMHVVRDWENYSFYVWTQQRPFKAVVKAVAKAGDPVTDLAVLKIEAEDLQPITFGSADTLKKGHIVIALGNPYGIARHGEASASWGIVSNLNRSIRPAADLKTHDASKENLHYYGDLIQVDARVNFGSSGGALINLRGELVGVTTSLAMLSGYERSGGLAYPVNQTLKNAVESLKQGRQPEFGFLGIGPSDRPPHERAQGRFGARVTSLVDGTPASRGGLRLDDIITHVNEQPIYGRDDLMLAVGGQTAGDQVVLRVQRGGAERSLPIKLSKKYIAADRPAFSSVEKPAWRGMQVDDSTAIPPEVLATRAEAIDDQGCVVVTQVAPDSLAWKAGVRPYTFISHVGGQRVQTPDEFFRAAARGAGEVALREHAAYGGDVIRTVRP
ncbi:trypsin-like peptidase domain-containing protein [Lignipirellula cremea]|uniref:Putative periplasmic serine endoprotease DegP-like n=1 Tax=Lignipirellula cremea TaxID=2528010 RepID=A0A518DRE1_9BACT|nr:trypsin-like peptidase domain-containing protein [Lignipirellula cremea]QDU94399.1 putative periplasmic serine endoprotease DegP-like precursor [Lignipirellula cremea]